MVLPSTSSSSDVTSPPSYNVQFIRAFENKDFDLMDQLVREEKVVPNDCLKAAVNDNKPTFVEYILQNGGDANKRDPGGRTVLHTAIMHCSPALVEVLFKHKANLKDVDSTTGDNALDVALQLKASIEDGDVGPTALGRLVNIDKIILMIIEYGMTLEDESEVRYYNLCDAIVKDDTETALKLIDETEDKSKLPLEFAVAKNRFKVAKVMLASGANVDNKRIIFWAIKFRNIDMVKLLSEYKMDFNVLDFKYFTPICRAVEIGLEMVELLVQHGADIRRAHNAMHQACRLGQLDVVKYLIKQKFDVNRGIGPMIRPLHEAIKHPEIIMCLLENGADVNGKNSWGQTALDLALALGPRFPRALQTISLLKERGATTRRTLTCDAIGNREDGSKIFCANFKFAHGRIEVSVIRNDNTEVGFACAYEKYVKIFGENDQAHLGANCLRRLQEDPDKVLEEIYSEEKKDSE